MKKINRPRESWETEESFARQLARDEEYEKPPLPVLKINDELQLDTGRRVVLIDIDAMESLDEFYSAVHP